ncbi:M28 family peptidase [soil metagenome]
MKHVRGYSIEIVLVIVLALSVGFFGYLGYGLLPSNTFSGDRAFANVQAQLSVGPRVAGTDRSVQASDILTRELTTLGWDVVIQPITLTNSTVARNIIAIRKNTDASAPVAILGAHYDSRAAADADSDPANHTLQTPGANDNASGVGVLLELARTLDVEASKHAICLVFFDDDDNANLPGWDPMVGSANFVRSLSEPTFPCHAPQFALVVEMVGSKNQRIYIDTNSHVGLSRAVWQVATNLGHNDQLISRQAGPITGAHTAFLQARIPAAILFGADYPYRHTMQDTLDKISAESLAKVGSTLETWLESGAPFAQN